jgi:hypothetical protein
MFVSLSCQIHIGQYKLKVISNSQSIWQVPSLQLYLSDPYLLFHSDRTNMFVLWTHSLFVAYPFSVEMPM